MKPATFPYVHSAVGAAVVCVLAVVGTRCQEAATSPRAALAGEPTGGTSTGKGRCIVRQDHNEWWLVSPLGEQFFSLGVCMFNQGSPRDAYDPAKPGYASWRHYDAPEAWAAASVARLESWGFTTIGGWSDYDVLSKHAHPGIWLTPVLHLGSTSGAPWFDMWDEKVLRRIDEVARQNIGVLSADSRVLGYYSDNELGWWNAILWKMTLAQPAASGQRQRLIQLVRDEYEGDWNALVKDFEPQDAANWSQLAERGMLWLRPGTDGIRTMRRFLGLVAERYYQVMRESIRKLDSEALYLGDRYQSFYYPEVVVASRSYVDAASTNLNASWNDGTFIRSYLDTLYALTGKPVFVGEFYMAAEENRSGNRNLTGGFPKVTTQSQRAASLVNTLRSLLELPYVVGADWFQYYDEPPHGRKLDGEDYNFGLVDIHDAPYEDVTKAFASLNLVSLKKKARTARRTAVHGVPRATADPFANLESMRALVDWNREDGFVPASSANPAGDLYLAWSPEALYLGSYVLDIIEPDYYRDSRIPEVDRAIWCVRLNGHEPITTRVGAGMQPTLSDDAIRVESLSGTYHQVRCISIMEIPAQRLGRQQFAPGDEIDLESSFITHARASRIDWRGTFRLGE
jgi:hypothetical protein